jgi:predicted SnoaL-like aldol condensation-catalyzing enzyme
MRGRARILARNRCLIQQAQLFHALGGFMRLIAIGALLLSACTAAFAQAPVTAVAKSEALFTSTDPHLHRNKQAAYHISRDLLEAGHWELADRWLTERYIQHNPNAASGRAAAVEFFTQVLKMKPVPISATLAHPITAVVAEGDFVIVIAPREMPDPAAAGKTYTIAWFDMWRFVDGKADEHWDGAMKGDIF